MTLTDISRFRRLSRAVTTQTGALDHSFLGLGRPLGTARVLNAIGHGKNDVGALRDYLGLDSGLMSRLLRGLEGEGLIETGPSQTDARRKVAQLTKAGQAAFEQYETLSDQSAKGVLSRYSNTEHLLQAMDLVATVLGRDQIEILIADPDDLRIQTCVQAYCDELSEILGVTFDRQTSGDPEAESLRTPKGVFLLAMSDGLPIGCCALKGQSDGMGEVKRMWVSPSARGLGLAKQLMFQIEDHARSLGMTRLRLDTNGKLTAALSLYRNDGWQDIPRYNDNPYAEFFFEKRLGSASSIG
ncbi:helix-turn-helix domain-containing GNAT family N-acetyltransferase [uncultured Pelagimonas sp.]|uniref:bifunctional helix-turn-helix transcriptional regulator/GNAT family N-acetyltransferase n=1 Tax=uncultured Pelagimonas sp. TaxID=1618102 RepID=UPI002628BC2C|nr:helix-turn-helix domain-containing GNAT family N-acetyltransferase [uncultured Pelagimonas sp.]